MTEEWAERAIERLQEGGGGEDTETEDERQVCLYGERERERDSKVNIA